MKYIAAFMIVLFAFPALAEPEIGKDAPAFSAKDINGQAQSPAQYKGKIVVVEWSNPECPFVKKFYGSHTMQRLQEDARKQGIVWITVNSGAPGQQGAWPVKDIKDWLKKQDAAPAAYILDPEGAIGRAYGAKTTPHMFIIDKQGKLAYMGAIDDTPSADTADLSKAKNYVEAALKALESGAKIDPASTVSYGCSVKYGK